MMAVQNVLGKWVVHGYTSSGLFGANSWRETNLYSLPSLQLHPAFKPKGTERRIRICSNFWMEFLVIVEPLKLTFKLSSENPIIQENYCRDILHT